MEYGGSHTPAAAGEYSYARLIVDFGDLGGATISGRTDLAHVSDITVETSSLNGKSGYYEWGFITPLDANGNPILSDGGSSSFGFIEGIISGYSSANWTANTSLGNLLGITYANDDINNRFDSGDDQTAGSLSENGLVATDGDVISATGSDNGNNTFNNTRWGLTENQAISGYVLYTGLFSMGNSPTTSGQTSTTGDGPQFFTTTSANQYLENFEITDDNQSLAIAIPEPSAILFFVIGAIGLVSKRSRGNNRS